MNMKPSKVLNMLRAGEVVKCIKINLADSRVVEIAGLKGFDCAWLDMEHVPNDYSIIEKQILAAKAYGIDAMVRVPRGSYSDYIRPLEMDASGIMVPHIMDLKDAQSVVKTTRFYPVGLRPVDGGNADGAYCNLDFGTYLKQVNERRFVAVQIEDYQPLEFLEEIAALDGIDILFFGPADFSHCLGIPGQTDHPKILRVKELVAKTALKHGKFAGTVGSIAEIDGLIDMGYQFINLGADVIGLNQYFSDIMCKVKDKTKQ